MKNWQFGIGEWAVVNGTVMKSVPSLVGKLVYIKELLTSGTYDYRVFDGDSEHTNVKEEELDKIPNSKLDTYLKFEECKKAKVKLDDEIVDILNINFNTEMVRVTNKKGLEVMFMLSALEPVELSFIDELDEDVSEYKTSYFASRGKELGEFIDQKQEAYGDSVTKTSKLIKVFLEDYLQEDGTYKVSEELLNHILLQVRIIDKQNRIFSNPKADKMGESPYTDISGYGLLGERLQGK